MSSCRLHFSLPLLLLTSTSTSQPSFISVTGGLRGEFGIGSVGQGNLQIVAAAYSDGADIHRCKLYAHDANGTVTSITEPALAGRVFVQGFIPSSSGGGYLAGSVIPNGQDEHDLLVVRIDGSSNVAWITTLDIPFDQQLMAIAELGTGGLVATGVDNASGSHDVLVLRLDGSGNLLWSVVEGGPLDEEGRGIAADALGTLITGRQVNFGNETDALLYRFDLSGTLEWQGGFGGIQDDIGHGVIRCANGTFVMAGTTASFGPADHLQRRKRNAWLIALESDGDTLWTAALGDTLMDREAFAVAEMSNGDLMLVGEHGLERSTDAWAMRTSNTGTLLWERDYDTGDQDRLVSIRPDTSGFWAAGRTFGADAQQVLFLRRDDLGF